MESHVCMPSYRMGTCTISLDARNRPSQDPCSKLHDMCIMHYCVCLCRPTNQPTYMKPYRTIITTSSLPILDSIGIRIRQIQIRSEVRTIRIHADMLGLYL